LQIRRGYSAAAVEDECNSAVSDTATGAISADPVDPSAAVLAAIDFDGFTLVAAPPLVVELRFDDDDQQQQTFEADIAELGIFVSGATPEQLMAELHDHLSFAWAEYAEAEDAQLSQDARDLKRVLLSRFQRIPRIHPPAPAPYRTTSSISYSSPSSVDT
jgi:hypothetical protein